MSKFQTFFMRLLSLIITALVGALAALIIGKYFDQPWATNFWSTIWPKDEIKDATRNVPPIVQLAVAVGLIILAIFLLRSGFSRARKLKTITPVKSNKGIEIQTKPLSSVASQQIADVDGVKNVSVKVVENARRPLFIFSIRTVKKFDIQELGTVTKKVTDELNRTVQVVPEDSDSSLPASSDTRFGVSVNTK